MIEWLRQFINQHKEMIIIYTGSIQNCNDTNKENEPEQIENPLVSWCKEYPEIK